jgi:hypothetical protein
MQRMSTEIQPSPKPSPSVGRAVDWKFAAEVGEKLVRPGPAASDYTRRQVIEQRAEASRTAEVPVREVTGLTEGGAIPEARIVDRAQWINAATQSMRVMTGGGDKPKGLISGRITGAQTGAVLAFVSQGILGQYDPFVPDGVGVRPPCRTWMSGADTSFLALTRRAAQWYWDCVIKLCRWQARSVRKPWLSLVFACGEDQSRSP